MGPRLNVLERYALYGTTLTSDQPLNLPLDLSGATPAIHLKQGVEMSDELRRQFNLGEVDEWFLSGHSANYFYLRWRQVADFAVREDGREVQFEIDGRTPWSVIQAYLLNQVLSCALLRQGLDSLHGVACEWEGMAYLFLGGSGIGKSTLLTRLLHQGAKFISDDLLVLGEMNSIFHVHRGLSRMKLYSDSVQTAGLSFLSQVPLSPYTEKTLCALPNELISTESQIPIAGIFILDELPGRVVDVKILHGVEKFAALARNVFNSLEAGPERRLVNLRSVSQWCRLPVSQIQFPRTYAALDSVVARILPGIA